MPSNFTSTSRRRSIFRTLSRANSSSGGGSSSVAVAPAASIALRGGGGSSSSGGLGTSSDNDDGIIVRNADGSLDYGCKGQVLLMMMMPQGGMGMGMHGDSGIGVSSGGVSSGSGGYMNQSAMGVEGGCMSMDMGMGMGVGMGMGLGVMSGGGGGTPGGLGDQELQAEMAKREGEKVKRLPELLRQAVASLTEDNWMFEAEAEGRE